MHVRRRMHAAVMHSPPHMRRIHAFSSSHAPVMHSPPHMHSPPRMYPPHMRRRMHDCRICQLQYVCRICHMQTQSGRGICHMPPPQYTRHAHSRRLPISLTAAYACILLLICGGGGGLTAAYAKCHLPSNVETGRFDVRNGAFQRDVRNSAFNSALTLETALFNVGNSAVTLETALFNVHGELI